MAIDSNWINLINNTTEAYSINVVTFDDLHKGMNDQKIKSNSRASDRFHEGPIVKTISGSSSESGSSSSTGTAVVNVKMRASNLQSKIVVQTFIARSTDIDDNLVKTGLVYFTDIEVIAGVAAVCGYSIGWNIATGIARWLIQEGFDWGSSAVYTENGRPQPILIGSVDGKTYIEENLFNRLIIKLNEWGLWNIEPGGYTPVEPVIGETITYDFTGRFPNIPSKYVDSVERLINEMINSGENPFSPVKDTTNALITFAVYRDQDITVQVWDTNRFKYTYRSPKMNGDGTFHGWPDDTPEEEKDITFSIENGGIDYYYSYNIQGDGDMIYRGRDESYLRTNFRLSKDPKDEGLVYDNFGTYRPIEKLTLDDGSFYYALGAPTDDLNDVHIDENAIDLSQYSDEERAFRRDLHNSGIFVSTPDLEQPYRDYPNATDLNLTECYVPITIPGRAIDPNSTQQGSITGLTDESLFNQAIKDTPSIAPRIGIDPDPTPDNPPKVTPGTPTLPDGISSFIDLYRISENNLATFATWLWTPSLMDNISRLVQNPMDAIIGLHAVYASPSVKQSGVHPIVGNLVCETTTADTIKQYAEIDCGKIYVKPYFKNINDYVATKIQLYLPFIGFVDVSTSEVMNRYIGIKYNVDFLTGTCTAFIQLRESLGDSPFTAYTFNGNCAVELPVTGANYANIVRNCITTAATFGSTAGAGALFGETMEATAGAALAAAPTSQVSIQRSGNCGANAGAMGIRNPYAIITRNVSVDADNRRHFEGLPQNMNVRLSAMSGYTRVKYINLESLSCTEEEKADILAKLKGGVFI